MRSNIIANGYDDIEGTVIRPPFRHAVPKPKRQLGSEFGSLEDYIEPDEPARDLDDGSNNKEPEPQPVEIDDEYLQEETQLVLNVTTREVFDRSTLEGTIEYLLAGHKLNKVFPRQNPICKFRVEDFIRTLNALDAGEIEEHDLWYKAKPEPETPDEAWWHELTSIGGQFPDSNVANAYRALTTAPDITGIIGFDEFTQANVRLRVIGGDTISPSPWRDRNTTQVQRWMQDTAMMHKMPRSAVMDALQDAAEDNKIDTLRMSMEALPKWDGTPRLDRWLIDFASAEETHLNAVMGRKFLIGMVERAMHPGAECKRSLILIGDQNIGKSGLCRILVGDSNLFDDKLRDINDEQKTGNQLRGKWLIEISEGVGIGRAERENLKSFLSRRIDKFTPKYSNDEAVVPRRVSFIMTTNETEILNDPTGHSRWMPVVVGQVDFDGLTDVRDQLFAEALAAYQAGERNQLNESDAAAVNALCEDFTVQDPIAEAVMDVLETVPDKISLRDLCSWIGIQFTSTGAPVKRVKDALIKAKWDYKKIGGKRAYHRTEQSLPPLDENIAKFKATGRHNIVSMRKKIKGEA